MTEKLNKLILFICIALVAACGGGGGDSTNDTSNVIDSENNDGSDGPDGSGEMPSQLDRVATNLSIPPVSNDIVESFEQNGTTATEWGSFTQLKRGVIMTYKHADGSVVPELYYRLLGVDNTRRIAYENIEFSNDSLIATPYDLFGNSGISIKYDYVNSDINIVYDAVADEWATVDESFEQYYFPNSLDTVGYRNSLSAFYNELEANYANTFAREQLSDGSFLLIVKDYVERPDSAEPITVTDWMISTLKYDPVANSFNDRNVIYNLPTHYDAARTGAGGAFPNSMVWAAINNNGNFSMRWNESVLDSANNVQSRNFVGRWENDQFSTSSVTQSDCSGNVNTNCAIFHTDQNGTYWVTNGFDVVVFDDLQNPVTVDIQNAADRTQVTACEDPNMDITSVNVGSSGHVGVWGEIDCTEGLESNRFVGGLLPATLDWFGWWELTLEQWVRVGGRLPTNDSLFVDSEGNLVYVYTYGIPSNSSNGFNGWIHVFDN